MLRKSILKDFSNAIDDSFIDAKIKLKHNL